MSQLISIDDAERDLFSGAAFVAENIRSADGHAEAVRALLPYYLAKDEVDQAAAFADSIEDPFTRDRLLTQVAERCAYIEDDEYAFQLIEAIEDYGGQSMAREKVGLVKSGQGNFAKAFEIADSLEHPDNVLAAIAVDSAQDGLTAESAKAVDAIEFPYTKVVALQTLAGRSIESGDKASAAETLEKAIGVAEEIDLTEEKLRALVDIAALFNDAARGDRAIETLDAAKQIALTLDNAHRDPFLAQIAFGFFRAGSIDLADPVLDLVVDKTQIASVLTGFSRRYLARGEKDEAIETLEEAYAILKSQHEKETRDSKAKFQLFGTIAELFAELGRDERALETAEEIPDETLQLNALVAVARKAAEMGRDDFATEVVGSIAEDAHRLTALVNISDAQRVAGRTDAALATLREASTLAEAVPQLASRSAALNEITELFVELGDKDNARRTSTENLETIAQIKDESSLAVCLAALAGIYSKNEFELNEEETKTLKLIIRKVTQ